MNKVYNTQEEIASEMKDFLLKSNPNMLLLSPKITNFK